MKLIITVTILLVGLNAWSFNSSLGSNCSSSRTITKCNSGDCFQQALSDYENHARSLSGCVMNRALPNVYLASGTTTGKTAKSIVLVHGLSDSPQGMKHLVSSYQKRGYNVVTVNLTGHGGTDDYLSKKASSKEWKKDVKFAYKIAQKLGDKVEGLGHSTGAAVLMNVASGSSKYKFSKLTVMDPAINFDGPNGMDIRPHIFIV